MLDRQPMSKPLYALLIFAVGTTVALCQVALKPLAAVEAQPEAAASPDFEHDSARSTAATAASPADAVSPEAAANPETATSATAAPDPPPTAAPAPAPPAAVAPAQARPMRPDAPVPAPAGPDGGIVLEPEDYSLSWQELTEDFVPSRVHHVHLTSDGLIPGRINLIDPASAVLIPIQKIRIFILRFGKVVTVAEPGPAGVFQIVGLRPGVYSLMASAPVGLTMFALVVLPHNPDMNHPQPVLRINAPAIPSADASVAARLIRSFVSQPPRIRALIEPPPEQIPQAARELEHPGVHSIALQTHPVYLQENGNLLGHLRRLHPISGHSLKATGIQVCLIQGGKLRRIVRTNELALFEFSSLEPGVYSVLAIGSEETMTDEVIEMPGLHTGAAVFAIDVRPASAKPPAAFLPGAAPLLLPDPPEAEADATEPDPADATDAEPVGSLSPAAGGELPEGQPARDLQTVPVFYQQAELPVDIGLNEIDVALIPLSDLLLDLLDPVPDVPLAAGIPEGGPQGGAGVGGSEFPLELLGLLGLLGLLASPGN